jgi:hypothetical protein
VSAASNSKEETVRPPIDDDSQRPTPSDSAESRADDEFNRRLLAKAAMAADLKSETKRPTFMEDDSSQSQPTLSILRLMNHVPMTSLIKGY